MEKVGFNNQQEAFELLSFDNIGNLTEHFKKQYNKLKLQ